MKIGLSLFLVYHLATVLLMPISGSMFGRKFGRYFAPYANLLGFNTTWQFFSPGPSPVFFLEYEIEKKNDPYAVNAASSSYPPHRTSLAWDDGWSRRLYGMRYLSLNGDLLERHFIPFLCRQYPDASAFSVRRVFEPVEDIERPGHAADESSERYAFPRQRFSCPERPS